MGYNIWPKIINSSTLSQSQKQHREYPSISIQLLESVLYNHHTHNPVLRGVVELRFKKPIVVSSLRLEFHGYLDYRLAEPECSLPLYPASPASSLSNPLVIQDQGDKPTRFFFEMPLQNNTSSSSRQSTLIQSIQCNEVQVNYQIKAVIEYHQYYDTSQHKETYIKRRSRKSAIIQLLESPSYPVVIIQIPTYDDGSTFFTSDNMYASIDSRKQSNHWCQYRVKIDKRFAAISSMLSLSVRIAPLIHGLKLAQVSMHIVQRFIITPTSSSPSSPQTFSRPPIQLECHHQSMPYPSSSSKEHTGGTLYEGEFQYKIPSSTNSTATLFDQDNAGGLVPSIQTNDVSNIKVEHHLLVYLALTYPKMSHDGVLRRARRLFTFQCDFDLLHPCMDDHISNELLRLPAYDDDGTLSTHARVSTKVAQPPPPPPPPQQCHDSVTLVNEFLHHHALTSTPPMYDQAILLPPAVIVTVIGSILWMNHREKLKQ
ncbi:hypothetical protein BCR42DRAFT_426022 [Absidia repens]|uniref:Arrestin-like N-terminal domain-containing protein n=1 Tax=Absidia repens TaxID=90262 RepID=A0A1X2I280_9FUNG|nr:hypothetical protein BCR42DRAFT_426022 [Absidia repens]